MWRTETEFIDTFLGAFCDGNRDVHVMKEFRTGYGLPDILVIEYDRAIAAKRGRRLRRAGIAPFDSNCAHLMVYLSRRRWVKIENVAARVRGPYASLDTTIANLLDRGLVRKKQDKLKSLPQKETFGIKNIVAIEAKLKDWKRAIFQAQRYLWFTNNSNILVPARNGVHAGRMAEMCKKYGVGLITLDEEKAIRRVIKAQKRKPYNTYVAWLLNESLCTGVGNEEYRVLSGDK